MPEPIIVLALLAFGFIAGWVISAAVRDRSAGAAPAPAPDPDSDSATELEPSAAMAATEPAPLPVPAPAAAPAPDLGRAVRGYEAVVDGWLDDDGQLDGAGRRSLAEFDAAVEGLDGAPGGEGSAVEALRAARDLIRERRGQSLDADTNRQLAELERAFT